MTDVMPCPEECEKSDRLKGCEAVLIPPQADGSCWRCDGVGYVEHDGNPMIQKVHLEST